MPAVITYLTAAEVNAEWRGNLEQPLTGADKRALAQYLGVSVRTVQRWTTSGQQQRNPIPTRLQGQDVATWPATYQRREAVTRRIARGGVSDLPPPQSPAEFGQVRGTLPAADQWAQALERGGLDPWLDAVWNSYTIEKTARGWEVRVVYDKAQYPKLVQAQEPK